MSSRHVVTGFTNGTGAAKDIEVGFIPDLVIISNETDGDVINIGMPSKRTMAFTSGGTNEIKAGHTLKGATSGATGLILQVITDTGTWAGGDAAGWFILDALSISGTFASENVYYVGSDGTNDATGAAIGTAGQDIDTEVAADTGITPYVGSSTASLGFSISSGISEDAKLLSYAAFQLG